MTWFVCFTEANVEIEPLDIPVNAVATALKDFFSKHLPPLFDDKLTTELEDIAGEKREERGRDVCVIANG